MKTKRPFVLATLLPFAFAGCSAPSPTASDVGPNAPRFDNGGGFGSGTRSDSTKTPAVTAASSGGTVNAGTTTTSVAGGGFGSGT